MLKSMIALLVLLVCCATLNAQGERDRARAAADAAWAWEFKLATMRAGNPAGPQPGPAPQPITPDTPLPGTPDWPGPQPGNICSGGSCGSPMVGNNRQYRGIGGIFRRR